MSESYIHTAYLSECDFLIWVLYKKLIITD